MEKSLKSYRIRYKETNLLIKCKKDLRKEALKDLASQYTLLERYIQKDPLFLSSYEPLKIEKDAPRIVRKMADAARKAGVGPMAAVAGAFTDSVAGILEKKKADEYIVENGGDLLIKTRTPRIVGVYAGPSRFSERIGFRIKPGETPLGICTSSDSVGHSISLGKSDAVTVFSRTAALSDAAATAIGNKVKDESSIDAALKKAMEIKGVRGALIIKGEALGAAGRIPELIKIGKTK